MRAPFWGRSSEEEPLVGNWLKGRYSLVPSQTEEMRWDEKYIR
jgi:hypothetical protein